MKTLFVSLTALLFAFFLGCQSTITDPEVPEPTKSVSTFEQETSAYKDLIHFKYPNKIRLEGSLLDPSHKPNGYAEIDGIVRYGVERLSSGSDTRTFVEFYKSGLPTDQKFKVNLYFNAILKAGCPGLGLWNAKQATYEIVNVNPIFQSVIYIIKTVRVKNTCCAPLNLVFKFKYHDKKLQLVSMELKLVNGLEPIIDN